MTEKPTTAKRWFGCPGPVPGTGGRGLSGRFRQRPISVCRKAAFSISCPQTPPKFHPDFDDVLGQILRANPQAQLVLTAGWAGPTMELVRRRILQATPDLADRIHVMGPINCGQFIGLLQVCDIVLDTVHYSGGNTSLEAFAVGAPVITWPGRFMRARHAYGFYRLMGINDGIAASLDDYVEQAIALGLDPEKRNRLRRQINERSSVLFENDITVRALEAFLAAR